MVDRYGGAANKNIGEAFLLVWKFHKPSEIEEMDKKQRGKNKGTENKQTNRRTYKQTNWN